VTFLKQYRPVPPPQNNYIEEQLMNLIAQENRLSQSKYRPWLWGIYSAIAAGLLLICGSVIRNNFAPKIAQEPEDLETFMVNSWRGAMGENLDNNYLYNSDTDWFLLTESHFLSAQP
jgi:hypothetical protein